MILAILQARMSSSRLPGKVMMDLLGKPMILRQIERIERSHLIDKLIVATSTEPSDDGLAKLCEDHNVPCARGSLKDVLDRFYQAASGYHPEHVVRLTADCPLADANVIDGVIRKHLQVGSDYCSNVCPPTFPDGLDVEVMTYDALVRSHSQANSDRYREHVTLYMREHAELFHLANLSHDSDLSKLRWTVDYPEDLQLVRQIFSALYPQNPAFDFQNVLALLRTHPEWQQLNQAYVVV
ncbi:glycosyltransferase family protein [Aliiglaciecola sp. CAU 1673]|uniref:glycosyltransferase family protein n=1 Tax=Aliiglaciecola sp. CAU 1673 TaxID=3032595 RepID=UPI0023DA8D43|nr:glycosyltransferase family protein [Aliiglaciecola sp. CAU 1673]MDF2178303.1 glycosyltransferase family protein [Aliiglaciecola sp. CAU 1673]